MDEKLYGSEQHFGSWKNYTVQNNILDLGKIIRFRTTFWILEKLYGSEQHFGSWKNYTVQNNILDIVHIEQRFFKKKEDFRFAELLNQKLFQAYRKKIFPMEAFSTLDEYKNIGFR